MSDVMDKKTFQDDELEPVSGGRRKESDELVALYNEYNPGRPCKLYNPLVLRWIYEVWDCDYFNPPLVPGARPIVHNSEGLNTYELPGYGKVNHHMFMKLTAERAAAKALK